MGITEKIDEIIRDRNLRAKKIEKQIVAVKKAKEAANAIMNVKRTVMDNEGDLIAASPLYPMFANDPQMLFALKGLSADAFVDSADKLIRDYEDLYQRFSRDHINVSVVGNAGQGKSRILQTITGLGGECIPSFPGDHCTGASSVIQNGTVPGGKEVSAEMIYKAEDEIMAEVQSYLNDITAGYFRLGRFGDIPGLQNRKTEIAEMIEKYNKENEYDAKAAMHTLFDRYVDHFYQWSEYVGKQNETYYDPAEIMSFVAQHNGKDEKSPDHEKYYKFIAVKQAQITTEFVRKDVGKVMLIDTEGLGANTNDTDLKMLNTIKTESDAVIFLKMPQDRKYEADPAERKLYKSLREQFESKGMKNWFAFICNRKTTPTDNINACESYLKYLNETLEYKNCMAFSKVVDASDRSAVVDNFLVPFLSTLSNNLAEIDKLYIDSVKEDAEKTYTYYKMLGDSLDGIAKKHVLGGNSFNLINRLYKETYGKALAEIRAYVAELSVKRSNPCEEIKNDLDAIVQGITSYLPAEEEINSNFAVRGNIVPSKLYTEYLDKFRNEITKEFNGIDTPLGEITASVKNRIASTLLSDNGGKLGKIQPEDDGAQPYERLAALANQKLNKEDYPQLSSAIGFLTNFEFSVKGFLIFKIRDCLFDFSALNSNILNQLTFNPSSDGTYGKAIRFNLTIALRKMQERLKKVVDQFYILPNEAMYALCDEFYDRVTFADKAEEEWSSLYGEYQMSIWKDELMREAQNDAALSLWMQNIDTFKECNDASFFIIDKV